MTEFSRLTENSHPWGKYKTNKQTKLVKEVKEKRKNILSSNSLNTSVPSLPISPNSSLIMTMKSVVSS